MSTSTDSLNGSPNLLGMAENLLKANQAVNLQERMKGNRRLDANTDAMLKAVHGDKYTAPADDVIAIDSPTTTNVTHHHYPETAKQGVPTWVKAAGIGAALVGAGLLGAAVANRSEPAKPEPPAVKPAEPEPKPEPVTPAEPPPVDQYKYNLDFAQPPGGR